MEVFRTIEKAVKAGRIDEYVGGIQDSQGPSFLAEAARDTVLERAANASLAKFHSVKEPKIFHPSKWATYGSDGKDPIL